MVNIITLSRPSNQTKACYKEKRKTVNNFKNRLLLNNTEWIGKYAFEQLKCPCCRFIVLRVLSSHTLDITHLSAHYKAFFSLFVYFPNIWNSIQGILLIKLERLQICFCTIGANCLRQFTSISAVFYGFQTQCKMNK